LGYVPTIGGKPSVIIPRIQIPVNIVIIHDDRRPEEERLLCEHELSRQGICARGFWPANYIGETVEAAINKSHRQVVEFATNMGWEEVCIMESDVLFPARDGWKWFLKNMPPKGKYDLFLAGTYGEILYSEILGYFYTAIPCGFHCYIIDSRYYDTFLATPADQHIDSAQRGGVYRLCYPFAAIQRRGWSANHKSIQDYNVNLKPADVYGWI